MTATLASAFAAIVNARLLPTQDRVDLARHLLDTGQVQVADLALQRAISRVMTADLAATSAWFEARDMDTDRAHPRCQTTAGHICQRPSRWDCNDCGAPAGTLWGPYWCPPCDEKRLNRISASFAEIEAAMTPTTAPPAGVE